MLKAEFLSSPFLFIQELFFPTEEFACLLLNLTIPFKLYVADAREAIEVLKNYLANGENKKGMSYWLIQAFSLLQCRLQLSSDLCSCRLKYQTHFSLEVVTVKCSIGSSVPAPV